MKNESRTRTAIKFAMGYAIGAALVMAVYEAKAQATPPGLPAGVNWVQGRAGGGPVLGPNQSSYTQYAYPTLRDLPYRLNPGAAISLVGFGTGATLAMIGQPVAGGIASGTLNAIGLQQDRTKPRNDMVPTITDRNVPTFGGGGSNGGGSSYASSGGGGSGFGSGWTVIYQNPSSGGSGSAKRAPVTAK